MGMKAQVTDPINLRDNSQPESSWMIAHREFECVHKPDQLVKLTVFTARNGTQQYRDQCLRCGRTVKVHKKAALTIGQLSCAIDFDEEIQKQYYERVSARAKQIDDERQAEWMRRYNGYLETGQWQRIRQAVMERDGWTCQGCRRARATQVHHLTYRRVGSEMLFDLVAICDECHRKIHQS